ncbi:MAG: hypothetical protein AAB372_01170 [Patescibacteria group bacterium]
MKRARLFTLFLLIGVSVPLLSLAAGDYGDLLKLGCNSIPACLRQFANFILAKVLVPLSVVTIFYAGFLFATAGGSDAKITSAKKTLTYGVIGIAVAFGAIALGEALKDFIDHL